ncbi:hypothetical protein CDL12_13889 [Handroanthus impetiginosus]|uniref:SHSP domain-containing protein n=1 Tax=Handroanthus impetiginosus TaxID=429701 RepID=A0A2G9H7I7_9LAMI|nr:hypothetical protein CDL12_13889 [Handroanthus impetiginosus]
MERKADNQSTAYEKFEPFCKWDRNEDRDIIEIHLKEFKKDQLKAQICKRGILKIFGERQSDTSMKSKFYKEIPVPSNIYDTQGIHAEFINDCLRIKMPKRKTVVHEFNESTSAKELKIDRSPKWEFELAKGAAVAAGMAAAAVVVLVPCVVYMCKSAICQVND